MRFGKSWRLAALGGLVAGLAVVIPLATSASAAQLQDELVFMQNGGQKQTSPFVEFLPANGTSTTQNLSLGSGACSSSTLTNPATQPLLSLSANYYPNGYGSTPVDTATVGNAVESGVPETGVCYNNKTSSGYTIQPGEGLDFGVGQSNSLTKGRVFSEATIPVKNNSNSTVSGTFVLRRLNSAGTAELPVDSISFTIPTTREGSDNDTNDCPVVSTGVVPAADLFDQLEIQVDSPSKGSLSVVGPNCDNDNDKDDVAYPTFYLDAAPAFTGAASATFTAGTSSNATVSASGYPVPTFTDSGNGCPATPTLPSGVTFADNGNGTATFAYNGSATTGGTYPICVAASNAATTATVTETFTLTMDQAPTITSGSSTTFTTGSPGNFTVTTSGFPTPTVAVSGTGSGCTTPPTLPTGVTVTPNSTGGATIAYTGGTTTDGTYQICLTASNGVGSAAAQTFTLTLNQGPGISGGTTATFTGGSTEAATVGVNSMFNISTTGFPAPAIYDNEPVPNCSTTLPAGLTFATSNGTATISGTPANDTGGMYQVCLTATNSSGTATEILTLVVDQAPAITSAGMTQFTTGSAGNFNVTANGYPPPTITTAPAGSSVGACNSSATLPTDLTYPTGTAPVALSGTPNGDAGSYKLCLTASNGIGNPYTQTFTLDVDQAPTITSDNNDIVPAGSYFQFEVTTSGYPPPSFSDAGSSTCPTSLPTDNSVSFVDNGNGTAYLEGTPAASDGGTYPVCITATSSAGSFTQAFTLYVTSPSAPLQATVSEPSGDTVSAGLVADSGQKSFTNFTAAQSAEGSETTVQFLTEGSSTYTATITVNWGDLAYCVPYDATESSTPVNTPICQPTYIITGTTANPVYTPVLPCSPTNMPSATSLGWCSQAETVTYPSVVTDPTTGATTTYTNIVETLFGAGDLTFGHP